MNPRSLFALLLCGVLMVLVGCEDDDGMVADTTVPDVGPDSTVDAAPDAAPDSVVADSAADTGPTDAVVDALPDAAGPCGAGPACSPDEVCAGDACTCIVEIDGDSYLQADGTVIYYLNAPFLIAETAPGTPLTGIVEIMDGWRHTCGLRDDGTVWCWAKVSNGNAAGELGRGRTNGTITTMLAEQVLVGPADPLTGITHLSDRSSSRCYIQRTTCAIRESDGALFCWGGDNPAGGTGSLYTEGSVGARPYATQIMASAASPLLGVTQVAVGYRHACVLQAAGEVACWGTNVTGPLGQGDQLNRQYPTPVPLPGGVSGDQIGTGNDFTCVRSGGEVFCWGTTQAGAVGLGDPAASHDGCINLCRLTPAQVIDTTAANLTGVVDLEVSYLGACGQLADNTLRCWGSGVGEVATEPTVAGAMLTDVAAVTTCGSNDFPRAVRYLLRDGTLHYAIRPVSPICM